MFYKEHVDLRYLVSRILILGNKDCKNAKKVSFSTKKRTRTFARIILKLNFPVMIHNYEFTSEKSAFYDNYKLCSNTVKIFRRAIRFVPPPPPLKAKSFIRNGSLVNLTKRNELPRFSLTE